MSKKTRKTTIVHEYPRHIPVSLKHPTGVTIVDEHIRRLPGTRLGPAEIQVTFKSYDRKGLILPTTGKLPEYKRADGYDDLIAVWTDYFNKAYDITPPLHPNVLKALLGSESGFDPDPKQNKLAFGIAQITKKTLAVLQDPKGEAKDFIFTKIRQKDLKVPMVAIALAARWLIRKRATATSKLGRAPDVEELILEYKGLLKSKTIFKNDALKNFRDKYAKLTE